LTWSELVGHAGGPAGAEGAATAGVLLALGVVPGPAGLAAVEPDAPGWLLLPDDAHPATATAQVSAAIVTASRPALSFMARR
jgi:3-oxoacyl-(acyl-carrier-protein) synthase